MYAPNLNQQIQLLGLPQDNNSSYMTGPAQAPACIRDALVCDSANLFTETGFDLGDHSLWSDTGDAELAGLSGQAAYATIYQRVQSALRAGHLVLSLGGDHSVSNPAISAYADTCERLSILHIDAHPDLYDQLWDNPFSHASPFARLMEGGKITRLVQVGIRTLNAHQRAQAERFGVEIHTMRDLNGVAALDFAEPVYLSLDLDALDPAFAPGVSHYEPGGLSTRQVIDIIHYFSGTLIGADVVELNPRRDGAGITAMVAAKLVKEIIGRLLIDQGAKPVINNP